MAADRGVRVLLTEGSSLTAREVVMALGPLGYRLEVCDPNPICLARFSRYVHAVHRCPPLGVDPLAHLEAVLAVLRRGRHDVLLPVHEQAFLLASQRERVAEHAGVAVAGFDAFRRVQGKPAFAALLQELGIPQPEWRVVRSRQELVDSGADHHYVKTAYSTAGQGVWRVSGREELVRVAGILERRGLLSGDEVLVQAAVEGRSCQVQSVFDRGRLVAVHCTTREAEAVGGGYAARCSVRHPVVTEHVELLGARLRWHGALTLDYFLDESTGEPSYIEANPRIVEPMNAALSGVNLANLLVRLSLGESVGCETPLSGQPGVRSHGLMGLCLAVASRGGTRRDLVMTMAEAARGRCAGYPSVEVQTPVRRDPPSALPLAVVSVRLLVSPRSAGAIAGRAVSDYSLTADAVRRIVAAAA